MTTSQQSSTPKRDLPKRAAALIALALVSTACGDRQAQIPETTPDGVKVSSVGVDLQEWSIVPEKSSAAAEDITFDVSNVGKIDHEFVVVRTDLDLAELPTRKDGSFDLDGDRVEVVNTDNAMEHGDGEHAVVEPTKQKAFDYELAEGRYVLLCNLIESSQRDDPEVHFKLGMRIAFEVA